MIDFFRPQPQELACLRSRPLGPHLESFAALLMQQGYCRLYGRRILRLAAALDQWLTKHQLRPHQLDERQANAFLKWWQRRHHFSGDSFALEKLLEHLRKDGAIPSPVCPAKDNFLNSLLRDYEQFLRQERGLLPVTIHECVRVARCFLRHRFPTDHIQLRQLKAGDAADYTLHFSSGCGQRHLQTMTSRLRVFFRFLVMRGL
jgi:hypothetical protein